MEPRTRSFDGCWTCRKRRVKCDQARPRCQRCIRGGFHCDGYRIVLGWCNPLVSSRGGRLGLLFSAKEYRMEEGFQRGAVDLVKYPQEQRYETFSQLNKVLRRLEGKQREQSGPFGVFEAIGHHGGEVRGKPGVKRGTGNRATIATTSTTTTTKRTLDINSNHKANSIKRRLRIDDEAFLRDNHSYVHADFLKYAKLTIIGIKGPEYEFNEQNMMHILYPRFFPNMDSDDDWLAHVTVLDKLFTFLDGSTALVTKHFKTLISQFLIDYHLTFIKNYYANNYLEILVAPFIKEVTYDILCDDSFSTLIKNPVYDSIDTENKNMLKQQLKLVIVYLVLSISSFNRYLEHEKNNSAPTSRYGLDFSSDIQEDLHDSIELRKICITIINLHLDEYDTVGKLYADDDYEYETFLMLAIFFQIQIDTYFSIYENFEFLFAIGSHILTNKFRNIQTSNNQLGIFLATLFRILLTFFESTHSIDVHNYSIEGRYNETSSGDEDDEENEVSIQNSAISILKPRLTKSTTSSTQQRNDSTITPNEWYYKDPFFSKDAVDVDLVYLMYGVPKSLIDIFLEVVLLANDRKIFLSNMRLDRPPAAFFRKCGRFERRIFNWQCPIVSPDSLPKIQKLQYNVLLFYYALIAYYLKIVKKAQWYAYHEYVLELYKYFSKLTKIEDKSVKPMFWALLIAGSELADKKEEIIEHWKWSWKSNYWRARQISYEVWKRRKFGEPIDWMDMVREWDVVLCLV